MEFDAASDLTAHSQAGWLASLKAFWQWTRTVTVSRRSRRLHVCETLSLGERRFLAVIKFDQQEFLVGGTGNSLEVLARVEGGTIVTEHSPSRKV